MTRPRQKVVWSNSMAAQSARQHVIPQHLGNFPVAASFWRNDHRDEGKMRAAMVPGGLFYLSAAVLLTGMWNGTEAAANQVAYVSEWGYNPSGKGTTATLPPLTPIIFMEHERLTEWDGKGWTRPERPIFLVNGVRAAALQSRIILLPSDLPGS